MRGEEEWLCLCMFYIAKKFSMHRSLADENTMRYIPVDQRELCIVLSNNHPFRNKLKGA